MRSTEPTSTARVDAVDGVELGRQLAQLLGRTPSSARRARRAGGARSVGGSIRSSSRAMRSRACGRRPRGRTRPRPRGRRRSPTRASPRARSSRGRAFSRRENTTKAPPWKREITQNTIGPSKFTTARPISAPYSSCSRRIDSGEPSKPARLASTTSGRRPRRRVDRARDLLRRLREQRARGPLVGAVGRHRAEARQRARLDAEHRHRPAAEVGVPHDRDLRLAHRGPALERRVVGVGHRAHHRADVERLLAAGVGLLGEDLADRAQVGVRRLVRRASGRRGRPGRRVSARRGKRSPGAT